jgi:hypothetical protein
VTLNASVGLEGSRQIDAQIAKNAAYLVDSVDGQRGMNIIIIHGDYDPR